MDPLNDATGLPPTLRRLCSWLLLLPLSWLSFAPPASAQTEHWEWHDPKDHIYQETCDCFETLILGSFTVQSLEGTTLVGSDEDSAQALTDVQIEAINKETQETLHTFSDEDGRFSLSELEPGTYKVWTCLDAFDSLEFEIVVDPEAEAEALLLWIGPSEAGGKRDVELLGPEVE